jgi:hypothetical protein
MRKHNTYVHIQIFSTYFDSAGRCPKSHGYQTGNSGLSVEVDNGAVASLYHFHFQFSSNVFRWK